jgi:hypothetical protein
MKPRRVKSAERSTQGDSVVVYRSGVLYEADLVAAALERARIPHFRREESSSGLAFAMPVAPSMGPGDIWAILVPQTWADRAERFIAELPVSHDPNPGVWRFRPRPDVKRFFKQWAWIYVVGVLAALLWSIISLFRE